MHLSRPFRKGLTPHMQLTAWGSPMPQTQTEPQEPGYNFSAPNSTNNQQQKKSNSDNWEDLKEVLRCSPSLPPPFFICLSDRGFKCKVDLMHTLKSAGSMQMTCQIKI